MNKTKMNKKTPVVLALTAFLLSAVSMAEVYKWKDVNGTIQYSDTPHAGGKGQIVQTKDAAVSTISTSKSHNTRQKTASAASEVQASIPQEVSEKDPKRCQAAKERKTFLARDKRYKSINDKGEVEFIGVAQREAELKQMEEEITRFCP